MMPTLIALLCVASTPADAATLHVDGQPIAHEPAPRIKDGVAFIAPGVYAAAIKLEAKSVVDGQLLILCNDVSCIPLHLVDADLFQVEGKTLVDARRLASATGRKVKIDGESIRIFKGDGRSENVDWKLPVGAMLPNVVLKDLEGDDVHLADYLGRRVLFCTWASW